MALTVVDRLGLPWAEFQCRLIDAIGARPDAPYWDSWLVALERLVVDHGLLSGEELTRTRVVELDEVGRLTGDRHMGLLR
jgi:hypothetical protein